MPSPTFITAVVSFLDKAFDAWSTFISTRQEAYERKMDKKQEKAINYAEEAFEVMSETFTFIYLNCKFSPENKKEFDSFKTKVYKLKGKFNKYD